MSLQEQGARRRLVVVVGVVVVVLALALVAAWLVFRLPSEPPALEKGPGVFRLLPERMPDGGRRAPYELSYDGASVRAVFVDATGAPWDRVAKMWVPAEGEPDVRDLHQGDTVDVDGGRLTVIGIHPVRAGSDAQDAVDVRLTAQ